MREDRTKVVTSMLNVQLKIIWKFEWKQTIINDKIGKIDLIDSLILPTILYKFNYILGECKSSQAMNWLYTIPDMRVLKDFQKPLSFYVLLEKRLGKFKNGWENLLLDGVALWRLQRKPSLSM